MLSPTPSPWNFSGRRLMPPIALSHSLPLPRSWPRRVRSAVVQVISLARTSLALTQGWASESMNGQLRRRAEGDRLQQEIQLLREEIRIKDARMEQLEAHRRPHYPPVARLAILELRAARGWSLAQTARYRALPCSASVRRFLEAAFQRAGERPHDLISDQGTQFIAKGFRRWCSQR